MYPYERDAFFTMIQDDASKAKREAEMGRGSQEF